MARDTFPQLPKNLKGNFVVSNTSYADRISAFKSYFTEVREYSISESKCSEFSKAKHCTCQVADLLSDEGNLATVAHIAESIMSLKFTNEEGYVAYINSENRPFKTDTFNVRHFVPQAPDGSDIPRHSFDHIICRGSWAKLMQVTTRNKWKEIVRHSDITGSSYRQDIDSLHAVAWVAVAGGFRWPVASGGLRCRAWLAVPCVPCRAVPCRAVPCRAVPCRA
eukprot:scaffold15118_cov118-Skeletonema_menzelii.AAC.4